MIKECPKCKKEFNCRKDEIFECHCIHVPVSARAQKFLAENYNECLCNNCLREVAEMFPAPKVLNKKKLPHVVE